ncbi:DUF1298 domain-containing protein [Rhodococcus sp. WS4]|nr:DUF1298 domain-containing protein [Rhodococcus sp. WS4]
MTQTDYMSWRMEEDPILRSTIVAVALLDTSPDRQRFIRMIERAVDVVPIFRRKVITNVLGLTPPRWVEDPDFDLDWHLRRFTIPDAGGWESVMDFARTTGMTAFDKDRPLWEFTVLDGLDGLDGDRAALVMKVHHSLTDGVGGMQIAREIVDFARDGTAREPPPDRRQAQSDDVTFPLSTTLEWYRSAVTALARRVASSTRRGGRNLAAHPQRTLRGAAAVVGSTMRYTRPVFTTRSPVMTKRSTRRRVAVLDVPMSGFEAAAVACGGSINDAFLASVLLGMRHYHRGRGVEIPELTMTLPMSLRTEQDPVGGNRITLARFTLPTDIDDPAELIPRVHTTVESWRHEPAVPLSAIIAGGLNLLPASVLGNMLKHVDFVASNVVGSPVALFVAGSEILRYYAFSPTLGSAFNVTLMSYTSQCCVGINADAQAVPDLSDLTTALAEGFRAVLKLCPDGTSDTAVVVAS